MIRPLTCICMLLAGGSGLYLYQSKHRALMLDREIARTMKQAEIARERITALRTEWALLNEPERLAELSRQHLGLRTLQPTQFVTPQDLGARLPPPLPPGSFGVPAMEPAPVVAQATPPAPARPRPAPAAPLVASAAPAPQAAPPSPTSAPAAIRPQPPATPAPVALTPPPSSRPAPPQFASVAPPAPMPRSVPTAPVVQVAAAPIARPPAVTASAIGDSVTRASALGGSRPALAPPTPYGAH